eukprot:TRINITY_DN7987_c0_g1_i1.p1 TRINITY_DN7987_c0_g1~~TRINITY_DN7987_c0_g1_i1.p1  ORF type:complete len:55 (+),score=12.04 TRINITY_DN7987_c0_g1_i1:121-285(+)
MVIIFSQLEGYSNPFCLPVHRPIHIEFFLHLVFLPHVLCVDTGRSSETAKAHRG